MKYVLDTHVWVWWVSNPENLSRKARKAIAKAVAEERVYISCISAWELALLVARNRLRFTLHVEDWIARSEALRPLKFVPVDNTIALLSVHLPGTLHSDPADRIIIATALTMGAALVTKDPKILKYPHVKTVW